MISVRRHKGGELKVNKDVVRKLKKNNQEILENESYDQKDYDPLHRKIREGDTVQLKAGGPRMVVSEVGCGDDGKSVMVDWFSGTIKNLKRIFGCVNW
jgi:uncharacterized protein YodC (DUF2158 family)